MLYKYKDAFGEVFENGDLNEIYYVLKVIQDKKEIKRLFQQQSKEFIFDFVEFCVDYFYIFEFQAIFIECLVVLTAMYKELFLSDEFKDMLYLVGDAIDQEVAFEEVFVQTLSFLECF